MAVVIILLVIALGGGALTLVATLCTNRLLKASPPPESSAFIDLTSDQRLVSILKPLCGADDGLEENLASVLALTGVSTEVIFSVADEQDPAAEAVRRVRSRFPEARCQLVCRSFPPGRQSNPKIERLIDAASRAQGDILLISDSNVRLQPDDLRRTLLSLNSREIGCVMNLFVGAGAETFGARLESLYLLNHILPGTVLAHAANIPVIIGKSIAVAREALEAVGGFEAFAQRLAEDQCMGLALSEAGYRLVLSPVVVQNVVVNRSLRQVVSRQVRWGKIRYSFSRVAYAAEFLGYPLPVSILAALVAALLAPAMVPLVLCLVGAVLVLRVAVTARLGSLTGSSFEWKWALLIPLQDLLQFVLQFAPYFSNEVTWRGTRIRIGKDTLIQESLHGSCYAEPISRQASR